MSSLKLKHSGGNSVIIAAPSSNPASDRTLTVPSNADGTILTTTNPKAGNIVQVAHAVNTSYASVDSTKNTFIASLSFGCQITPSSTSNIIILYYSITLSAEVDGRQLTLTPTFNTGSGVTQITTAIGDAGGSRTRVNSSDCVMNKQTATTINFHCKHSPNSVSQHTYGFQHTVQHDGGWIVRNAGFTDTNDADYSRYCSSITAMEVAV